MLIVNGRPYRCFVAADNKITEACEVAICLTSDHAKKTLDCVTGNLIRERTKLKLPLEFTVVLWQIPISNPS